MWQLAVEQHFDLVKFTTGNKQMNRGMPNIQSHSPHDKSSLFTLMHNTKNKENKNIKNINPNETAQSFLPNPIQLFAPDTSALLNDTLSNPNLIRVHKSQEKLLLLLTNDHFTFKVPMKPQRKKNEGWILFSKSGSHQNTYTPGVPVDTAETVIDPFRSLYGGGGVSVEGETGGGAAFTPMERW